MSGTYDILGHTLTMGATKSMGWDVLNRMTSYTSSGATTTYAYRADGLRVKKRGPGTSPTTTYYRYDGQMPVEEFNYRIVYPISYIKILRYALGARGIDRIERVPMYGSHLVGYPLYDAHGNNIATLTVDHTNHFSVPASDKRSYGPWGDIRTGSTTGEPQPRHCANLGHLSDDESGFVYMRARYYEPGSGRFISEDPGGHGSNWFAYANDNPVSGIDASGRNTQFADLMGFLGLMFLMGAVAAYAFSGPEGFSSMGVATALRLAHFGMVCFAAALEGCESVYSPAFGRSGAGILAVLSEASFVALTMLALEGGKEGTRAAGGGLAGVAVWAYTAYSLAIIAALAANSWAEEQ